MRSRSEIVKFIEDFRIDFPERNVALTDGMSDGELMSTLMDIKLYIGLGRLRLNSNYGAKGEVAPATTIERVKTMRKYYARINRLISTIE